MGVDARGLRMWETQTKEGKYITWGGAGNKAVKLIVTDTDGNVEFHSIPVYISDFPSSMLLAKTKTVDENTPSIDVVSLNYLCHLSILARDVLLSSDNPYLRHTAISVLEECKMIVGSEKFKIATNITDIPSA